jgi:hypothetical protein
MTTRTALPKTTNQSLLAIKKKRFAVAAVIETADRLAPTPFITLASRFASLFFSSLLFLCRDASR